MIKGILFDKDGTLIEFYSMWMEAAVWVVPKLMEENHLEHTEKTRTCILEAMGIVNGQLLPDGALAYKVYEDIAQDICDALKHISINIDAAPLAVQMAELFQQCLVQNYVEIRPLCDLKKLLTNLKNKGFAVGMATADTMCSAKECLRICGIYEFFDYIGADDGMKKPKPHPQMFQEFQDICSLNACEIAVVGDTHNDMLFGKENGGISIGVLSGVCKASDFSHKADYVLPSVDDLEALIDQWKEQ